MRAKRQLMRTHGQHCIVPAALAIGLFTALNPSLTAFHPTLVLGIVGISLHHFLSHTIALSPRRQQAGPVRRCESSQRGRVQGGQRFLEAMFCHGGGLGNAWI